MSKRAQVKTGRKPAYAHDWLAEAYRQMFVIRLFEQRLESLYGEGLLRGSLHLCIGQEATASAAAPHCATRITDLHLPRATARRWPKA